MATSPQIVDETRTHDSPDSCANSWDGIGPTERDLVSAHVKLTQNPWDGMDSKSLSLSIEKVPNSQLGGSGVIVIGGEPDA